MMRAYFSQNYKKNPILPQNKLFKYEINVFLNINVII